MLLKLHRPNEFENELKAHDENSDLIAVRPRVFAGSQRMLSVIPFSVTTDSGVMTDRGCISVNARTGVVKVEHMMKETDAPVDQETESTDAGR
jgi:hypothetical protein